MPQAASSLLIGRDRWAAVAWNLLAARVGLLLMAVAGLLWGLLSYPYLQETLLCGSVGLGFGLVFAGLGGTGARGHLVPAGLVVAALGSGTWTYNALAAGNAPLRWGLFGLGIVAAAVLAVLAIWRPLGPAWPMRLAFILAGVALVNVLIQDSSATVYNGAIVLGLLATAVLVAAPPVQSTVGTNSFL